MTHFLEFKRSQKTNAYFVYAVNTARGEHVVGRVLRVEKWTVRGTRVQWEASRMGAYVGSFATRKEAGEALYQKENAL